MIDLSVEELAEISGRIDRLYRINTPAMPDYDEELNELPLHD